MSGFKTDEWFKQPDDVTRAMPHSVGCEKGTLSVILQYPEMLDESPILSAEHYYDPSRKLLFEILSDRIRNGKSVDMVEIIQELLDTGKMSRFGDPSKLADVYSYAPAPNHFHSHVGILNEKMACRMAIRLANNITEVAYSSPETSELIEVTSSPITLLHDTLTSTRPSKSTKQLLQSFYESFASRLKGESKPEGMQVSISILNRLFGGLHKKHTVVISAYPSGGKTALAVQLAVDLALDDHNTLICSLEMSDSQLMERVMSYLAKVHGKSISDPQEYMRENDLKAMPERITKGIQSAIQRMIKAPFEVEDLIGSNVHQIAAIIRRAHRKQPLQIVVVDFIQRITPAPEMIRENRERQLSHASNTLANLAKELGFCLILPSQLNKEGAAKHAETINEDADLHLQIMQNSEKQHIGIKVEKDRHFRQGGRILPIVLDDEYLRFKEVDVSCLPEADEKPKKKRYTK